MPKLDIALRIANEEHEFRSVLRDISARRYRNFILDLEPMEAQMVLKMALQFGMINSTYHFILTTLDIETMELDDFKYNRANITGLRFVKTESQFYNNVMHNFSSFLNTNSPNTKNHRTYANKYPQLDLMKIFRSSKNALLFDAVYFISSMIREAEKTEKTPLNINAANSVSCTANKPLNYGSILNTLTEKTFTTGLTGLISFQNKKRKEFELDVLQLKESGLFKCGSWSHEMGLNFTFYDEIYEADVNPKKGVLKVVTLVVSLIFSFQINMLHFL